MCSSIQLVHCKMSESACESGFHSSEKQDGDWSETERYPSYYVANVTTKRESEESLKEKLDAACRNIDFLKREHATMIHGLHKEIERLQNYIRDLQFQQNVLEVIIPDNEFFNCDIATLEQKVDSLIADNRDMKRRLQESNRALEKLDQKQSLERWQQQQELQDKDKTILRLQKELENKCSEIAELKLQLSRKKKGSFLRRFSFNSESASPNVKSLFSGKGYNAELLPQSPKAASLPARSSPSHSLNCDYSSYSSLSDRSTSDDEFLRTPFLRKQYTFPSPRRGLKHSSYRPGTDESSFKLPPILPSLPSRQLIRQQIRVDKVASKVMLDSMAIDQVSFPELADKI